MPSPAKAITTSNRGIFSPKGAVGDGVTDDTASIQSAIDAAASVGGVVQLESKTYRITAPLVIDQGVTLKGRGVITHPGPAAANPGGSINIPVQAPYLSGSVLLMTAAATNAIEITSVGDSVNLNNFGIRFADAIKFEDTGHGIYQMPPDNVIEGVGTFKDNGPQNGEWRNLYVYGNDGNHYAFYSCNSLYNVITNVASAGGGGWCHENNGYVTGDVESYNQITGNVVLTNGSFFTFAGGSAHCVHIKNTAGVPAHITMVRPQGLSLNAASYGAATQPTSAQSLLKVDYGTVFIQIFQAAWENLRTGTASKVDISDGITGFFMTPSSSVGDQPIAERGVVQMGAGALPTITSGPISWGRYFGEGQRLLRINEPDNGSNYRRGFYASTSSASSDHFSGWYVTDYGDNKDFAKWGYGELSTAGDIFTWNQWVSQKGNLWARGYVDGGSRYYKELASNQTSITTTLAGVTGMAVTLPAGTYELTGIWSFSNSAGGTGANISLSFSQALSTTWKFSSVPDSGFQTPKFNAFASASQSAINITDATGQFSVIELHRARITVLSSTTITVEFAQATLNAGINTVLLAGSYFEARRLI